MSSPGENTLYSALFENYSLPLFVFNKGTLRISEVNKCACLFLHIAKDKLLNKQLPEILSPADSNEYLTNDTFLKKAGLYSFQIITSEGIMIECKGFLEEIAEKELWVLTVNSSDQKAESIAGISPNKETEQKLFELGNGFQLKKELTLQKETIDILERISDAFVSLDKNWRYTYMNKKAGEIFNRNPQEMIGKHIWTEFPEGISQPFHLAYEKAMVEQKHIHFEEYYPPYNKWFENHIYPSPEGISVFFQDITQRKLDHKALEESELRYKTLFQHSPVGIAVQCDGKIVFANNEAARIIGAKDVKELIGLSIQTIVHPDDWINTLDRINRTKLGEKIIYPVEARYQKFDGSIIHVMLTATPITYEGKPAVHVIVIDNTERKNTQLALQESERRFSEMLDTVTLLSVMLDDNGIVTFCNNYLLELTGYRYDEIIGKNWFDIFIDKKHENAVKESFKSIVNGNKYSRNFENEIITKSGERLIIKWTNTLLRDITGKINGTASIGENITDQRKTENALKLSEEKFHKAFMSSPDCIVITDFKTKAYIDVNEKYIELSGYKRDELIGHSSLDINIWGSDKVRDNFLEALKKDGKVKEFVGDYKNKIGQHGIMSISTDFIQFGDRPALLTISRDITEQKNAENELKHNQILLQQKNSEYLALNEEYLSQNKELIRSQEILRLSEEKFFKLFHLSPDAITLTKLSDRKIIDVNESASKITGYSREELIGSPIINIKFWENSDELDEYQKTLEKKRSVNNFEASFKMKTGENKTGLVSGEVITINNELFVLGIIRDITDRKHVERELNKQATIFKALVEQSITGIYIFEKEKFIYVNEHFAKVFGYSVDEIVANLKPTDVIKATDRPVAMENINQRLSGTIKSVHYIAEGAHKDGNELWIEIHGTHLSIEGKDVITGTILDITEKYKANLSLKASEEHFRTLFEQAPDAVFISDRYGRFYNVNSSGNQMFGYSKEELLTLSFTDLVPKDEVKQVQFLYENIQIQSGYRGVHCCKKKNGSVFYTEIIAQKLPNSNVQIFVRDITERKRFQDELKTALDQLKNLYDNLDEAIFSFDVVNNKMLQASIGHEKVFGYPLSNFYNNPSFWYELILPEDKPLTDSNFQALYEGKGQQNQVRIKRGDGEIRWIEARMKPVLNEDGKTLHVDGIITDITERKYSEEALILKNEEYQTLNKEYVALNNELKENLIKLQLINSELIEAKEITKNKEQQLSLIADNFVNGMLYQVISFNETERKFTYVSDAVKKLYGCNPEDILQNPAFIYSKIHADDIHQLIEKENDAIKLMTIFKTEARVINPDGSIRWSYFISKPRILNGLMHWDGIEIDITERKKLELDLLKAKERAEESDKLKTAFLQNMSHEIRTPMNAIMGFSDLLQEHLDNKDKIKNYTEIIKQRCADLLEIINDILDIAKIEAGQLPIHIEKCYLNSIFTEVENFFLEYRKRICKETIDFDLKLNCRIVNKPILIDQVKLKQVLINLISNAFKFTHSGKIEVGCELSDYNKISFYISDTGIGIPENKIAEIFERFKQANTNTSVLYGGTGLGLSIVKGILELLGGTIRVESVENKGSTFYFTIPYSLVETDIYEDKTHSEVKLDKKNIQILIVEDDPYNTEYLKEILSGYGFTLLFTDLGKKAIEMANQVKTDIILMDIRLPDITGYEATQLIKRQNPEIRIIAQTAYATHADKQLALAAGCDSYLSKPINKMLLFETIQQLMKNYQP